MPTKKPVVSPAPMRLPLCTTAIARCRADTTCASSYAAFEESCKEERGGMPVNCTQGCRSAIIVLITHPLGTAALTCNCSNPLPLLARTCLASQTNLQTNCFPAPPGTLQSYEIALRCHVYIIHAPGHVHLTFNMLYMWTGNILCCCTLDHNGGAFLQACIHVAVHALRHGGGAIRILPVFHWE